MDQGDDDIDASLQTVHLLLHRPAQAGRGEADRVSDVDGHLQLPGQERRQPTGGIERGFVRVERRGDDIFRISPLFFFFVFQLEKEVSPRPPPPAPARSGGSKPAIASKRGKQKIKPASADHHLSAQHGGFPPIPPQKREGPRKGKRKKGKKYGLLHTSGRA